MDAELDVLAPEQVRDPYPFFERMRRDVPVQWNDEYRAWFVYRYEDVFAALRSPAFSSDRVRPVFERHLSEEQKAKRKPTFDVLMNWLVFLDPPEHTRLRRLVMPAFTPKAIAAWRPRIEAVVRETLEELRGREEFDLIADFAYPIPAVVIAELMGVPREDRDKFKEWSDEILTLVFGAATTGDRRARAQRALVELTDYIRAHVAELRRHPEREDVISAMLAAGGDEDPLTDQELVATCALLIFGGHETTTNFLANGIRALNRHPEQLALLRDRPELIGAAVEELLRYDGPSKMVMRRLVEDVEMGGVTMRAGDNVYLVQSSANHDPEAFDDPEALNIERKPNPHVAFGFGIHHCLGNILARLEGNVGFTEFIKVFPTIEEREPTQEWLPTLISRGMVSFPVRVPA